MKKSEKLFLFCSLGAIVPIFGFLTGWFVSSVFLIDWQVMLAALCGGMAGLGVDAIFLRRWVENAYRFDIKIWMGIFVFYSICIFGFFMGVPIFNLVLAIPAGFFIARKRSHFDKDIPKDQCQFFWTKLFTTFIFGLICIASTVLALRDPYTAANLEGMLRLSFEVTQPMIIGLIVLGGGVVIILNWWLTAKTIQITNRRFPGKYPHEKSV